ncbi:PAS domain-containing protein [Dyadobacter sp. CY347]|uniref:PAS domain-containing protein n=1 Tax=Dyadobacter sp. CY347 TaxID=2909336 RepID=UPI001F44753F|nr:PAS domain-containing protein [Dyadobacter sp. CY347]MCF2489087.1 PAS domain S-box protein [Dyadobacter sp. CY347]
MIKALPNSGQPDTVLWQQLKDGSELAVGALIRQYFSHLLAIWLAYFAIPLLLFLFLRKKKEVLPFGRIFWLFILFIFSCGLTHLADSIMFWIPVYRVSALLLLLTAIISWATVITLLRLLPELFALKSPAQVEAIMEKRFHGLTEQLKQSEERWQFALEGSGLGVWDWNTETNEVFFSRMWKEMLGYENHEISSSFNEWEQMIHPDDKRIVFEEIEKHISGNSPAYRVEHRLKCKDGSYKWILTSGMVTSRTIEGKALRLVGTHDDINTSKIQQEKLRISENTFSNAFHFSSIGLGLVAPTGLWLDVNPALCTLLGYSREELLKITFQDITHPDDLHIDLDFVQQMINREITTCQMEKRYFHRNGQIIWVLLSVSLVWELENKPKFFISQIVDISTIKHLMAELELKNETLQLNTADLAGKMRQLEEFNRIVAHNLRGPAGNIKMLLEILP